MGSLFLFSSFPPQILRTTSTNKLPQTDSTNQSKCTHLRPANEGATQIIDPLVTQSLQITPHTIIPCSSIDPSWLASRFIQPIRAHSLALIPSSILNAAIITLEAHQYIHCPLSDYVYYQYLAVL